MNAEKDCAKEKNKKEKYQTFDRKVTKKKSLKGFVFNNIKKIKTNGNEDM